MKLVANFFFGILILVGLSNCANGKKLQEKEAPRVFEPAFYNTWQGNDSNEGSGLNFFLPVRTSEEVAVIPDSVYFRGRSAKLELHPENALLYVGHFSLRPERTEEDFVMSSDPREEYGNPIPQIKEETPFDLQHDEAVISYLKEGKRKYFKLTGIKKQDKVLIKKPQNLQH